MSITFHCPHCGNICAFDEQHIGRRARCTKCQKRFIIPCKENEKPSKVEVKEIEDEAISGFYRAVLAESWRAIFRGSAIAPLIFIGIVVGLKFLLGHPKNGFLIMGLIPVYFGWAITIFSWGTVLWYVKEVIYATGFGEEDLPSIKIGLFPVFMWKILVEIYSFFILFVVVEGPFLAVMGILKVRGVETAGWYYLLGGVGFFAVPMAFIILSVGRDLIGVVRLDQVVWAIIKGFGPYLVVLVFALGAVGLQFVIVQYSRISDWGTSQSLIRLGCNIAAVYFSIVAGRVAGLFYRHYGCFLPC